LLMELSANKKNKEKEAGKQNLSKLFMLILLQQNLQELDNIVIKKYLTGKKIHNHEKCVIVSAITISLLNNFDERKITALFDIYDLNEPSVWTRAFVGLVLGFYNYNSRISIFPGIIKRMKLLSEDVDFEKNIETIIIQLIKTRETAKISDQMRTEIIPQMEKFRPKMEDKLNLDKLLSDKLIEDKNPDWEEIFDDSPELLNKMAKFSEMQISGSDVFMSAFSMLKQFPFFDEITNWFLPFYKENEDIHNAISEDDNSFNVEDFAEGLEKSAYMCNSDKYSFCMNLGMMPKVQKKMISELFKIEATSMDEIAKDDKILNKGSDIRQDFTRYIQDLYRFFKLHPIKNEFNDLFETKLEIYNTFFFKQTSNNQTILRKAGELYFKNGYYNEAIEIFMSLDVDDKELAKIYEKAGYAYQKQKDVTKALEFYNKAESFGSKSVWLLTKIAFCYRKKAEYSKALKYYKLVEKEQPDDLGIQANIGHCLVSMNKFEEALKYYIKIEYFEPENIPVMRPLAWCYFVTGKLDKAKKYYIKIIETEQTAYDLINYAHVLMCENDKKSALEYYLNSANQITNEKLVENLNEDKKYLIKNGVSQFEINLLVDYLEM